MKQNMPIPVELPEGYEEEFVEVDVDLPEDDLPVAEPLPAPEHGDNLVEFMDDDELSVIASELIGKFDEDKANRSEWEEAYKKGLKLLGFEREKIDKPWDGACGVSHPVLSEAVVMFQSQAIMELFPASGPVRTKIIGAETPERKKQASRVREEMNYFTTEKMTEFRPETEQMLFQLPIAGSAFKKIHYSPPRMRPISAFVPAEDFVVPYGASDLETCPRYTHIMRKYPPEIARLQASGFYTDVDLSSPTKEKNDLLEEKEDMVGEGIGEEERLTLLEMHVDYDLGIDDGPFAELPYVITIDKASNKILAIRRNWREGDPNFEKRMHFVHHSYIPGLGFYGIGLVHLIGGIAASATSILRQLVDAGTLSNLPGGLRSRGLRNVKGDDAPIAPGEWRDVDVPAGKIADNLFPLPYKEPSATLYQLLNNLVDEGRRIGSIADIKVTDAGSETPVGTTLAIIERATKVMSAVHARLHATMKDEFKIISELIYTYMPPKYEYDMEEQFDRTKDFDGRIDIIPVSDPNSATMAQRQVQYQAALAMAQQAPDVYDMRELHREALNSLGLKNTDKIVPIQEEAVPLDPVSENMSILTNRVIKVFEHQDHKAHMEVHLNAFKDPRIAGMLEKSPNAKLITGAFEAHIAEHMAMQYRREIAEKLGVPLPELGKPLPPEIENDVARLSAKASKKVLAEGQKEVAEAEAEEALADPVTQIAIREIALKEKEFEHQVEQDDIDNQIKRDEIEVRREKIEADKQIHGIKTAVDAKNKEDQLKAKSDG